jgi:hypothetical protein
MHRHVPRLVEALLGPYAFRQERTRQPKSAGAPNNLTQPLDGDTRVRGEPSGRRRRRGAFAASLLGLAVLALWLKRRAAHA